MADRGALQGRRRENRLHVSETLTHGGGKESGRRNKPGASARLRASTSVRPSVRHRAPIEDDETDGRRKKKTLQGPIQLFLECRDACASVSPA